MKRTYCDGCGKPAGPLTIKVDLTEREGENATITVTFRRTSPAVIQAVMVDLCASCAGNAASEGLI